MSQNARLAAKLQLFLNEEIALGPGKMDLLEAIRDCGSISQAGKKMGMSYRRAWLLVDTMNRCFRMPLVETNVGGSHGGGAQLSPTGVMMLHSYRVMQKHIDATIQQHFTDFAQHLRDQPQPPLAVHAEK
jgi:molybdate transport system regulatory protein